MIAYLLAAASVTVTSLPERPYAEIVDNGFALNGDLIAENKSDIEKELIELRIDAFGPDGKLMLRTDINDNGSAPAIELIPSRTIKPGATITIFNPLDHFPVRAKPARVDYVMTFWSSDKKRDYLTVTVIPRPSPPERYGFPLKGRILVWDGHDAPSHHRRFDLQHPILKAEGFTLNASRYAFDLILVDPDGQRSRGDEKANESWFSFGKPVVSTGDGVVESVRSDLPDNRQFDETQIKKPNTIFGNYVIVKERDGHYVLYGHLQQGTALVRSGDRVRSGQLIARIGASGSANFPHLHYQRMEGPNDRSEGVPTRFKGVIRPDGSAFANGYVDSGDIVIAK